MKNNEFKNLFTELYPLTKQGLIRVEVFEGTFSYGLNEIIDIKDYITDYYPDAVIITSPKEPKEYQIKEAQIASFLLNKEAGCISITLLDVSTKKEKETITIQY